MFKQEQLTPENIGFTLLGVALAIILYQWIIPGLQKSRRHYILKRILRRLQEDFTFPEKSKNKGVKEAFSLLKEKLLNAIERSETIDPKVIQEKQGLDAFIFLIVKKMMQKIRPALRFQPDDNFAIMTNRIEQHIITEYNAIYKKKYGKVNPQIIIDRLEKERQAATDHLNDLKSKNQQLLREKAEMVDKAILNKVKTELKEMTNLRDHLQSISEDQKKEKEKLKKQNKTIKEDYDGLATKVELIDIYPPFMLDYFQLLQKVYILFSKLKETVKPDSIFKPLIHSILRGQVASNTESLVFDVIKKEIFLIQLFKCASIRDLKKVDRTDFAKRFIRSYSLNVLDVLAQITAYSEVRQAPLNLYKQLREDQCRPDEIKALFEEFQQVLSKHFAFKMVIPNLFKDQFTDVPFDKSYANSPLAQTFKKAINGLQVNIIYDLVKVGFQSENNIQNGLPDQKPKVIYKVS